MATDHLQIPDITASQNQKEATANVAHNLLDRAMNQLVQKTVVSGSNMLSATQARENGLVEVIGTPGAPWQLDMPDTNQRVLMVYNNSDDQGTIRNSASGGSSQPVIEVGEATIFHYDGTDFIDISSAAITASTFAALTDTPSSFSGQSGQMAQVNTAENGLEFILQAVKRPVVAASTGDLDPTTDLEAGDSVDGVTLAAGDRVLLKDQSTLSENGIYIASATGAASRAEDFDDDIDVVGGVIVAVNGEGTVNANTVWVMDGDDSITVDTDDIEFVQFGSVATFSGLSDTPSSMSGESGTEMGVNDAETAIEYRGRAWKIPVRVASAAAGTLSSDFENGDTVDGVSLSTGDRILIKDQGTASENGIYTVNATGAPTRAADLDDVKDFVRGCVVAVEEGTANANTLWQLDSDVATIDSDDVDWVGVGGSGSQRWTEATAQTTAAETINIATIALASGDSKVIRGFGVCRGPSGSHAFSFTVGGENTGGTSALIAAAQVYDADGAGDAYNFSADVDDTTDTIRLRATSSAAETVNWTIQYEVIAET